MNEELKLRRILATETKLLNELLRDEDIAPGALIGHTTTDGVDLLPFLADEHNIALVCEREVHYGGDESADIERRECLGAVLFAWIEPGCYEVHTMAKKEVRGRAYVNAVNGAIRTMFLCWDCMELYTRVPETNRAALGLVRLVRGRREFVRADGVAMYVLRWYDWLWGERGEELVKRGAWFHERLEQQFAELGREHAAHADNEDHDRVVGATCELVLSGMVDKGIILYNRWAKLAGYATISIVVQQPLILNTGDALVQVDFAARNFLLLDVKPDDLLVVPRTSSRAA